MDISRSCIGSAIEYFRLSRHTVGLRLNPYQFIELVKAQNQKEVRLVSVYILAGYSIRTLFSISFSYSYSPFFSLWKMQTFLSRGSKIGNPAFRSESIMKACFIVIAILRSLSLATSNSV